MAADDRFVCTMCGIPKPPTEIGRRYGKFKQVINCKSCVARQVKKRKGKTFADRRGNVKHLTGEQTQRARFNQHTIELLSGKWKPPE